MNRGNKLWEGHRMIIPEHRAYMLEIENRQAYIDRPYLDEDKMNDMSQTLGEAMQRALLITVKEFHPTGYKDVEMVPQRVVDGKLRGIGRGGDMVSVPIADVVDVVTD